MAEEITTTNERAKDKQRELAFAINEIDHQGSVHISDNHPILVETSWEWLRILGYSPETSDLLRFLSVTDDVGGY